MNGLSYATNRKILAGSRGSLEIFYLWLLEKIEFFDSKKFLSQGVC